MIQNQEVEKDAQKKMAKGKKNSVPARTSDLSSPPKDKKAQIKSKEPIKVDPKIDQR